MERRPQHACDQAKSTIHSRDNESDTEEDSKGGVRVQPKVGLVSGISLIVGIVIGSGIFISPKGVTEASGSVGLSLVSWTLCGLISLPGGEYIYLLKSFGRFGKVLAFLVSWSSNVLLRPAAGAAVTQTCAEYIMAPIFDDGCGKAPEINIKLAAITLSITLVAINIYSTVLATKVQVIFTIAKILALCLIIVGGFVAIIQGKTEHLSSGFEGTTSSVGTFVVGLYQGMWAYDGWSNLNICTQDVENPNRNLLLSICIAIPFVIVIYLLTNISYFTVMSVDEILSSPAVAMTWANIMIPAAAWIMPLFVAMSTFGSSNGGVFAAGRLVAATARQGSFPEVFGMVHVDNHTPLPAFLLYLILVIFFTFLGDFVTLVNYSGFIGWMFSGLTMVSLFIFRYTLPDKHRSLKVPIIIPLLVMGFSILMVVIPMILEPRIEFLYAAISLLIGLIFYVPFVHFRLKFPGMDYFLTFMQLGTKSTYSLSGITLKKPVANITFGDSERDKQTFTTRL